MERVLNAAGLPQEILARIPDIIDTCRECRIWKRPGNNPTAAVELTTKQNEVVEGDILFYKKHMAWHMVDRADRFEAAREIPNKEAPTLQEAIYTTWISIFGPFKTLVTDSESGIISAETVAHLKRQGTRAPGQHAQIAERRGAILRNAMHLIEEQLKKEGITIPFAVLLAEAIFASNALVSHGGATPYTARFGTSPAMIPGPQIPPDNGTTGRYLQRVREVALQKIIESIALSRIERALNTITYAPGDTLDYQPRDLVDFWRAPPNKDVSGWHGPAQVILSMPERGLVKIRWQHKEMRVKFPEVRRYIDFASLVYGLIDDAMETIVKFTQNMRSNQLMTFGHIKQGDQWRRTTETTKYRELAHALNHHTKNALGYSSAMIIRLGKGISKLPECHGLSGIVLLWKDNPMAPFVHHMSSTGNISTQTLAGNDWPDYTYLQIIFNDEYDDAPEICAADPEYDEDDRHSQVAENSDTGRLSTIQEGDDEDLGFPVC